MLVIWCIWSLSAWFCHSVPFPFFPLYSWFPSGPERSVPLAAPGRSPQKTSVGRRVPGMLVMFQGRRGSHVAYSSKMGPCHPQLNPPAKPSPSPCHLPHPARIRGLGPRSLMFLPLADCSTGPVAQLAGPTPCRDCSDLPLRLWT